MTGQARGHGASNAKTQWIERLVGRLVSHPLMHENVFFSARYLDGKCEKEVTDVIVTHGNEAVVISVKANDKARTADSHARWLAKHGNKSLQQLRGAFRTMQEREFWCQHPTLGRRDFARGEVAPRHCVSLLESKDEVCVALDSELVRSISACCPTTTLSIDDFINIVMQLRTWRDLTLYLDARTNSLAEAEKSVIGIEWPLFCYYTAHRDSFANVTIRDAKAIATKGEHVVPGSAFRDRERGLASIVEHVMTQLSSATPGSLFEAPAGTGDGRAIAAALRHELCDLTIQERAAISEQLGFLCQQAVTDEQGTFYASLRIGRLPDRIYLCIVSQKMEPQQLLEAGADLTLQACVHFGRSTGIMIALGNGDGQVFFHAARLDNVQYDAEMAAAGHESFAHAGPRRIDVAR